MVQHGLPGVMFALLITVSGISGIQESAIPTGTEPPKLYISKGACPFECCVYREWVARADMKLLDRPNGKRIVDTIKKGERVQALTGEVHCVPVRFQAEADYPEADVKTADTIYILHSLGEGYWKAWRNGRVIDIEVLSDLGPLLKTTWWVKIQTRSGIIGWTISKDNFDNQDACG